VTLYHAGEQRVGGRSDALTRARGSRQSTRRPSAPRRRSCGFRSGASARASSTPRRTPPPRRCCRPPPPAPLPALLRWCMILRAHRVCSRFCPPPPPPRPHRRARPWRAQPPRSPAAARAGRDGAGGRFVGLPCPRLHGRRDTARSGRGGPRGRARAAPAGRARDGAHGRAGG